MKLWSEEVLLLGGIYSVFVTPLAYIENNLSEQIATTLFVLFIVYSFMLCLNKTPKFISRALNLYPCLSYYLISIGWIPYFIIVFLFLAFLSGFFIEVSDAFIEKYFLIFDYTVQFGVPFSLMAAFAKKHFHKRK